MNKELVGDLLKGALEGMTRYDAQSSDSQTLKIVAAVALGVGVTAVAGVAVAAALGGFVLLQDDSINLPWSRYKRPKPLSYEKWTHAFEPQEGRLKGCGRKIIGQIRRGGCDPGIRSEVWPFLLGLYEFSSSESERQSERQNRRENYEELRRLCKVIEKKVKEEFKEGSPTEKKEDAVDDSKKASVASSEGSSKFIPVDGDDSGTEAYGSNSTVKKMRFENNEMYFALPNTEPISETVLAEESFTNDDSALSSSESDLVDEEEDSPLLTTTQEQSADSNIIKQDNSEFEERVAEVHKRIQNSNDLENFATWQRIMRLDAVRMNAAWVPYSLQSEVSMSEADEMAKSVNLSDDSHLDASRRLHAARLVSILEAYAVYDFEIGYCQGMSDLLSPFVALIEDDSDAFWCYQRFMEKARQNFRLDEIGIRSQLNCIGKILKQGDPELFRHLERIGADDCIFAYRMVVVLLRRELSFEQTITLWEILWADCSADTMEKRLKDSVEKEGGRMFWHASGNHRRPCNDLLLYVIAAVIKKNRSVIMSECSSLDEVLRLCNSFSGKLNIWSLLNEARGLFALVSRKND